MRYRRSLIIGFDEFGDDICNELRNELNPLFIALNPILKISKLDEESLKKKIQKKFQIIRTPPDSNEYPAVDEFSLPGATSRDPLKFNIISLAKNLHNLKKDYDWLKLIQSKFCKKNNINSGNIKNLTIFQKGEINQEILPGDINYIMSENLSNGQKFAGNIKETIKDFLLFLIYAEFWSDENRDFCNNELFQDGTWSLGIKAHYLPLAKISDYISSKLIKNFINEAIGTNNTNINKLSEKIRADIPSITPVNAIQDINLKKSSKPALSVFFSFFSTKKNRKNKLETYINLARKNLNQYFKDKKKKIDNYRKELDRRLGKYADDIKDEWLKKIKNKANTLNEAKILLIDIIGKKNQKTPNLNQEIVNKKNDTSWQKFTNYEKVNISKFSPHPSWLAILFILLLIIVPIIIKKYIITGLSNQLIFIFSGISLAVLVGYIIFSIYSLKKMELQLKKNYFRSLDQIDDFFHNNIDSLKKLYAKSFLEKILIRCKEESENLDKIIDKFNDSKRIYENNLNVYNKLEILNKASLKDILNSIESEIKGSLISKNNMPGVSELWNWQEDDVIKKKKYLQKLFLEKFHSQYSYEELKQKSDWIDDINQTYKDDKPDIMSNGQRGTNPRVIFFSDKELKEKWIIDRNNQKFIAVERTDFMGIVRFALLMEGSKANE